MSKEKQKEPVSPFKDFSVIQGKFTTPDEEVETDIITGDEALLKDEDPLEAEKIAAANKKMQDLIDKKIKSKEIVETTETKEDEEEETIEEEDDLKSGIKAFTNTLYDKGVIDFNAEDEDFEESEEGIEKLVEKTVEKRIDNWASKLPDDFSKFLEYCQAGGQPRDFLNVYYGNHSWEGFTVDTEDNQKAVVRESLRLAGEDPNEIEEIITEWADNGKLEDRAKKALTKVQKHESTQKAEIVEITKAKDLERKKLEKESFENFKKELYSKDEVLGFKLTPKLKDKLWEHMTLPDRNGKTGYDKALEKNKDAQYLFALQSMNDFDITKLEKQVETKVTKKVNNLFKNYSKGSKEKISSGTTEEVQETSPFAGFKKI
jgi:hypothetical protein